MSNQSRLMSFYAVVLLAIPCFAQAQQDNQIQSEVLTAVETDYETQQKTLFDPKLSLAESAQKMLEFSAYWHELGDEHKRYWIYLGYMARISNTYSSWSIAERTVAVDAILKQTEGVEVAPIDIKLKALVMQGRTGFYRYLHEEFIASGSLQPDNWSAVRSAEVKRWLAMLNYNASLIDKDFDPNKPPQRTYPKGEIVLGMVESGPEYEKFKEQLIKYRNQYNLLGQSADVETSFVKTLKSYYETNPYNYPELVTVVKELKTHRGADKAALDAVQKSVLDKMNAVVNGVDKDPFPTKTEEAK